MNYIFKSVALLSMGVLLAQCGKDEPEVVQFKDGYTVKKPQAGKRDKAPDVNLLDLYGSFTNKEVNAEAELNVQENVVSISRKPEISVGVQTSFPVSKDVTFKLSYDAEKGATSGKTIIPETDLEIPATAVVAANSLEVNVPIQIKEDALKKLKVGTHSFYLKLSSEDASVQFKGDDRKELLVNVKVEHSEVPVLGTPFRDGVSYSSEYASSHLWKLNDMVDGKPNVSSNSNWWVSLVTETDTGLTVTFTSSEVAINGFKITTADRTKMLGGATIYEASGNKFVRLEGVKFTVDKTKGFVYVKFAQPVKTKYLFIGDWAPYDAGQQYVNINDIEFYK